MHQRLAIIIVSYGNSAQTIRFVTQECPKITFPHEVIVVDNGPDDASKELENGLKHVVKLVCTGENVGFARGNIAGVQAVMAAVDKPDYLLFVNNDIVFTDPFVVDKLVQVLEVHPEVGLIGPRVVGLDGGLQSPEPYLSFCQRHILPYWGTLLNNNRKKELDPKEYARNAISGWHYRIMGSFLLMRTEDYFLCGGFDPGTFLFSEESILSERLAKVGKKVWYESSVSVLHEHAATTSKYFDYARIRRMKLESDIYYYRNYRSVSSWEIALARFTLWLKERLGR